MAAELPASFAAQRTCCSEAMKIVDEIQGMLLSKLRKVGKRVLICDDDANIRFILKRGLEKEGFQVTEAVDGADCLKQIEENDIGVVLLDLNMPRLDGEQVMRVLKDAKFGTVLLSADVDRAKVLADRYGVKMMAKPFKMGEVVTMVTGMLPRREEAR